MSNVIASLEKVLLPFAVKIGKQPHVNAIKNGFIRLMPLTLAGAMFVLINNVFLSFGEGSFFYSLGIRLDASTIEILNGLKGIGGNVYNGTLGIMSLMAPFFIGMALAEERKVDALAALGLAVKECPFRYVIAQHFLQTHGLSAELELIGVRMTVRLAALILHREGLPEPLPAVERDTAA